MKKRGLAGVLACVMVLGCVGCGNGQAATGTETETEESTTQVEESTMQTEHEDATQESQEPVIEYYDEYSSLAELAKQYGFELGAAIGDSQMGDEAYKDMLSTHFSSLTATNELKAYSLLDQAASQADPDGMPVMNYTKGDKIVAFAQENNMLVRGHTLVWDAYMTEWFFREGYRWDGDYVDTETMKARLESYIEDVITHFETEFPGVVYCWDVVNEAIGDSAADYDGTDERHIRKYRNGQENPFYTLIGSDYVELSFLYAKNTVEKLKAQNPDTEILLFYNDYSTFYDDKRTAICKLATSINSYATDESGAYRKLCDGIGMQSYIGGYGQQSGCMSDSDLVRIQIAIVAFSELDLQVHATELAVRNYQDDAATMKKHAEFYKKLFEVYAGVSEKGGNLTSVSIWGLCDNPTMSTDDYSYKMNGPFCGLFDENYNVKDSFRMVYELLAGTE